MLSLKFIFLLSHFWYSCKDCRYSSLQQDQNSSAKCWIHETLETIFDSMVNIFTGDNGCELFGSLRNAADHGLEFKIPFTPLIKFQNDDKMALAKKFCSLKPHLSLSWIWNSLCKFYSQRNNFEHFGRCWWYQNYIDL